MNYNRVKKTLLPELSEAFRLERRCQYAKAIDAYCATFAKHFDGTIEPEFDSARPSKRELRDTCDTIKRTLRVFFADSAVQAYRKRKPAERKFFMEALDRICV